MKPRQLAVVCLLVAVGAGALAVPSVAFHSAGVDAVQVDNGDNGTEFGVQVSSFAQASATDTSESVDAGMWEARINNSDRPEEEIQNRTASLDARLDRLSERTAQLENRSDNLSEAAYNARASALRVQAANLRSHVERANMTATQRGVDTAKLDELRNKAANVSGPEVAAAARNITDRPRRPPQDSRGGGPAGDSPGMNDSDRGPGNGMSAGDGDRGSAGDNTTRGDGPAGDAGPGSDSDDSTPAEPGENSTDSGDSTAQERGSNTDAGTEDSGSGADEDGTGSDDSDTDEDEESG